MIPTIDSILLKNITDLIESITDEQVKQIPLLMISWACIYAIWWQTVNLIGRGYDYLYLKTIAVLKGKVIDELFNYTQHHHHRFFQNNLTGNITNRITDAARSFELFFAHINEQMIRKLSLMIFTIITMYTVHYKIANVFSIWVGLFITISLLCSKTIHAYSSNYAKNRAILAGNIVDSISNIFIVRMFSAHKFERKYIHESTKNVVISDQKMQWFMFKLRVVIGSSCAVMIFIIIYYLAILRSQLLITIGDCVLVITLCLTVVDDLWDMMQEFGDMFEEFGTFSRSMTLIDEYQLKDIQYASTLKVNDATIEFKNVTFQYLHNDNLFKNKSILIPGNHKIGLVGYSGSGKTTFVNLIARLYDIEDGSICIDNQDIKYVTQESLRNNISIIPQEPILFHRSILENIKYGQSEAPMDEIIAATKAAHIHNMISALPNGYDTICGERGNNFSGGQKQRIVIARAILKKAPILILDEATNSLDSETESVIQESLENLMKDKTVLVIAHRLSTLLNMDKILVFDKGNIVAEGNHHELLNNNEIYTKLWNLQFNPNDT